MALRDEPLSEPGDPEELLDHERPRQDPGGGRAQERDHGEDRAADRVPPHDLALGEALGARGADEVLLHHLDRAGPREAGDVRGIRQPQRERGEHEVSPGPPSRDGEPPEPEREEQDQARADHEVGDRDPDRGERHAAVVARGPGPEPRSDAEREAQADCEEEGEEAQARADRQRGQQEVEDRPTLHLDRGPERAGRGQAPHVSREETERRVGHAEPGALGGLDGATRAPLRVEGAARREVEEDRDHEHQQHHQRHRECDPPTHAPREEPPGREAGRGRDGGAPRVPEPETCRPAGEEGEVDRGQQAGRAAGEPGRPHHPEDEPREDGRLREPHAHADAGEEEDQDEGRRDEPPHRAVSPSRTYRSRSGTTSSRSGRAAASDPAGGIGKPPTRGLTRPLQTYT